MSAVFEKGAMASLLTKLGYPNEAVIVVAIFLAYLVVFTCGMRTKRDKRQILVRTVIPALSEQFYRVEETRGDGLNELTCYATGRRGCRSATGKIRLKNAHDLLSFVLLDRIFMNENRFLLQIDFVPGETACPFVYAIVHTKALAGFLAFSPDVRAFAQKMPLESLPKSLVCHTENRDCVVLTPRMTLAMRRAETMFRYLHISDQIDLFDLDPPDRGIRLCTRLPETFEEQSLLRELILATCELVDVVSVGSIFPNNEAREAAIQARVRVNASLSRLPAPVDSLGLMQQFLFTQSVERRYSPTTTPVAAVASATISVHPPSPTSHATTGMGSFGVGGDLASSSSKKHD